jgi:hypothetical protein
MRNWFIPVRTELLYLRTAKLFFIAEEIASTGNNLAIGLQCHRIRWFQGVSTKCDHFLFSSSCFFSNRRSW